MKYIRLSGDLYLTGQGGITRVEALSDYDPNRKGKNKTLVHGTGFKAVVEETVDQIGELLGIEEVEAAAYEFLCDCELSGTFHECLPL